MFAAAMSVGSSEITEHIQISACQLIELAIQNSYGTADSYIKDILGVCMQRMDQHFYGIALPTVMFNVFGNILYYNPNLALQALEANNWTQTLFTQWFTFFEHFQRIYDRKITVLGLSSIFLLPSSQWPSTVKNVFPTIFVSCLHILHDAYSLRVAKANMIDPNEKAPTFADEALVNQIRQQISHKDNITSHSNDDDDLVSDLGSIDSTVC